MAELILSPVLDLIVGNLASAAMEEVRLVWGVDKELKNLKSTLSAIQAVLEDAEYRQSESNAVKDWLEKLQNVAYDADDLVDEIATEAQQSLVESGTKAVKTMKNQVCNFLPSCFSCITQAGKLREVAQRIRDINEQLDKIAREKAELHLQTTSANKHHFQIRERQQLVGSVRDESEVFGRQKDREEIVESLLSDDSGSRRKFSVIAIVGMGGQGKTTLAQLVHNDGRVTSNFELRAWVCVSEEFDVIRLMKEIIESASGSSCDLSSTDALQRRLHDILSGKKFLVVLDDVWNENSSSWEKLQAPFKFGARGSKILVTTRSQAVSNVMQPAGTYILEGLTNEDCWSLFSSQAFVDVEDTNPYPRLTEIGRKLVEKCKGLPLAAKALGGLLSSTREEREWENILNSKTWELHGVGAEILPALRLSYQHLPAYLKRCFIFCSIYPKDPLFTREDLVRMWIAHGFVHSKEGEQIEDTSSRYFNELLLRSFFQYSTRIGWYTMHDLFHDLAKCISGNECLHMDDFGLHGVPQKVRHLSLKLVDGEKHSSLDKLHELKGLRTLFLINLRSPIKKFPQEMFDCLRFIRVLELIGYDMPESIGNLRHLRYLKFQNPSTKELPESICSIYNLQTLILFACRELEKLPNETSKLINLRHLDLNSCLHLKSTPPRIGRLTRLQTLSLFLVGKEKETGIAELKELTGIRGNLEIRNLENVERVEAAREANLKSKRFVDKLTLGWGGRSCISSRDGRLEEEIAEELQPHPRLKQLIFSGYMGSRFPSWMMQTRTDVFLSNLTAVDLVGCGRCSILPPLGQLPSLVYLRISGMGEVNRIEEGPFVCLRLLRISDCPQLISLPRFPSLEELELFGLENLKDWCSASADSEEVGFRNLRRLSVHKCPKIKEWPGNLPALTILSISYCWGLDAFPLISSLSGLEIGESGDRLWNSLSCLASLRSLTLFRLELTAAHRGFIQVLTQLKALSIMHCDEMETFVEDDGLQNGGLPSTLARLFFQRCHNLKALPRGLHAVTSLRWLGIHNCPQIASLPHKGLPPQLENLDIYNCHQLVERCRKDTGEDWPKISHIPHVSLDCL